MWCSAESTDSFEYSVKIYDIQRTRLTLSTNKITVPMKKMLKKMNELYASSFTDDDEVWAHFYEHKPVSYTHLTLPTTPYV